jgi:predicted MFS family arabinose efflux permease
MEITAKLRLLYHKYPSQFWLLFFGMLVSTIGTSMVWPFLTIYIRQTLDVPLTTVASLITLSSVCSLLTSSFVGQLSDRFGRKSVMVFSLLFNGVSFYLFSQANALPYFAILMALRGGISHLYRIAADALVADLMPPDDRLEAYSLIRMANNAGIAIGPSIGGFLAVTSYDTTFHIAAVVLLLFSLVLFLTLKESPVQAVSEQKQETGPLLKKPGLLGPVLKDRRFMKFAGAFTLTRMASILVFTLLAVYAKENFGVSESQYGFLMAINAGMVVFFQIGMTRITRKRSTLTTLTIGALFYMIGVGSIAFGSNFLSFAASIVVMTIGELMIAPTATATVANFAPPEMHGRYLGAFWVTVEIARAIGPVMGGLLNDNLAPAAIWYAGGLMALLGALMFARMARGEKRASKSRIFTQ